MLGVGAHCSFSSNHWKQAMQTTKRRSAEAWRAIVVRFSQSGLTEEAFCEGEGISPKLFHRWRMKRGKATPRAVLEKPTRAAPSPASSPALSIWGH